MVSTRKNKKPDGDFQKPKRYMSRRCR